MSAKRTPAAQTFATPRRQRGATAVEFAILFPLFFMILYGLVTYGMIFAAQQTLTLAATEGARAALGYQAASTPAAALAARADAACTAAKNLTGWLAAKGSESACVSMSCAYAPSMDCIQVTVTYPYAANPLLPAIPLFGAALVPSTLSSQATVQLNPANLL
ncbi:pilus assembly protein TadE [Burkholderia singularis]|uniref:Pilus assembly protein TadE n=1 Tax=Burkholderia singularis TaxID=1503053 RepID=A0A103E0G6_9BURK|nr:MULTISPECIES: TadE family protein [Burkholderia]AOK29917.1 pilus assembly protein TadE [Burkholderia sp. Bp7605]KVE26075.1 pilus assembly protein TadE [Burkholderia singularis]